jgi:hypothetical protein
MDLDTLNVLNIVNKIREHTMNRNHTWDEEDWGVLWIHNYVDEFEVAYKLEHPDYKFVQLPLGESVVESVKALSKNTLEYLEALSSFIDWEIAEDNRGWLDMPDDDVWGYDE